MSSLTVNYGFYLPAEGDGQANGLTWAQQVNANFEEIDTLLKECHHEASSPAIIATTPTGTVQLPNLFTILNLTTTEPGRFRLYQNTASRDADLARPVTQEIEAGHGLLLEFVTVAGQLAWGLSPLAAGAPATPGSACAWAWDGPTGTTITLGIYREA